MEEGCAALAALAVAARAFLEPVWPGWHRAAGYQVPDAASTGTCGRSSLFLCRALREAGFPAGMVSGAFLLPDGTAKPHAWVACGGFVIDVTADQFGAAAIVVTLIANPRYRPGTDTAWPHAIRARHAAVDAIWPAWVRREGPMKASHGALPRAPRKGPEVP